MKYNLYHPILHPFDMVISFSFQQTSFFLLIHAFVIMLPLYHPPCNVHPCNPSSLLPILLLPQPSSLNPQPSTLNPPPVVPLGTTSQANGINESSQ